MVESYWKDCTIKFLNEEQWLIYWAHWLLEQKELKQVLSTVTWRDGDYIKEKLTQYVEKKIHVDEQDSTMNKRLKENLYKAIDLAQGSGDCLYVCNERPHCVIAQLAFIEGISIEEMKTWSRNSCNVTIGIHEVLESKELKNLSKYNWSLLVKLQNIWDMRIASEDNLKGEMKRVVDKYY